jgi:hypothetical protein
MRVNDTKKLDDGRQAQKIGRSRGARNVSLALLGTALSGALLKLEALQTNVLLML